MMNISLDRFGRPYDLSETDFELMQDGILDTKNKLMWYLYSSVNKHFLQENKHINIIDKIQFYIEAINISTQINTWRLPTINELSSILVHIPKYCIYKNNINTLDGYCSDMFNIHLATSTYDNSIYWSSTSEYDEISNTNRVWCVDFKHGTIIWSHTNESHYVQLVRDIK